MAADPADILAVAFVVDSSLSLAQEWSRIVGGYIKPILKRLLDTNQGYKLRMAFVTYATADMVPSPVLCKRFFAEPYLVTKEMGEHPAKLGIGQTNSGADSGMAALEGMVAAIELFETLYNMESSLQQARSNVHHLIHIASGSPDSSARPQYNDMPALDLVTWDDIPNQFRKRSINFTSINLSPHLPRFSEVYSSTIAPGVPHDPWFPVRPTHTILLANFPVAVAPRVSRRPGEVPTNDRPTEAKRPRVGNHPIEASPKVLPRTPVMLPKAAHTSPSSQIQPQIRPLPIPTPPRPISTPAPAPKPPALPVLEPTPSAVATPSHPSAPRITTPVLPSVPAPTTPSTVGPSQAHPSSSAPQSMSSMIQYQKVLAHSTSLQECIRSLLTAYDTARNSGDTVAMENIQQELQKKKDMYIKFLLMYKDKMGRGASSANQAQGSHSQVSETHQPSQNAATELTPDPAVTPAAPLVTQDDTKLMDVQGIAPNRSSSGGAPLHMQPNAQIFPGLLPANPATASPMQKLVEHRERMRSMVGPPQNAGHLGMDTKPPAAMGSSPPQLPNGQTPVWQGSLMWSGVSQTGRKDVVAHVFAASSTPDVCLAGTWPKVMNLVPTQTPAVPIPELQSWIKRHKPAMCSIFAQSNVQDSKGNERALGMLNHLLSSRNVYASAQWILPSGEQSNNVLFFPIGNVLAAAFFPRTGIPENPKPMSQAFPLSQQELHRQLQAAPAEHREMIMAQLRRQIQLHQQQQKQHQHQQVAMNQGMGLSGGGGGSGGGIGGPTNNVMMMNMLQQQQQQQQQQGLQHAELPFSSNLSKYGGMSMNAVNGLGQQQPAATMMAMRAMQGMGGNINPEMMQSFMQRNTDGNSAMPG